MTFFQNSVLSKHLKTQDPDAVKAAYAKFTARFHNPEVQENIRNSKEEQYQGEFLIDLFVNVLGYTKNPAPAFNLTTEYKNVKDSKKADGAIVINQAVKAVIELKGTDTTDLSKIENQAFGYKNNQPECAYVITSNFEKLRFYIDNAIDYKEFNLFTLTASEFELLWLCLAFVNIGKDVPRRMKAESLSQEDAITKNLYNDYSLFKRELHQNLVALNPQYGPLTLFKKSQKLLDRFLFLLFAEDRNLLPPNSVRLILADWKDLQDRDVEIPLYDRFKKYFGYLNTGYKGKRYDVYAYNGGLFVADEILDAVLIDDQLLYKHTLKLSEYDFVSEVDVNILGHIFENSLNELDEIQAQLEGKQQDKAKSKRKKDGVFYTPKYITKYIVDNTIGRLCSEKKAELQLNEEDYTTNPKRSRKAIQSLFEKLNAYRDWLLQLTICDPACGSGAFLNQALDFLISEHRTLDELQGKLFGSSIVLGDFENSILENNLFGVDINEESVEIAKLSLWLRTAQPNRKLSNLNNNIKCGNSLIDDPAVASDKAFNWQQEFPQVFKLKDKSAWHVTFVTHDTRTSARMIKYRVRERRASGEMHIDRSVYLDDKDSLKVSGIIAEIVLEEKINCLAYNIYVDHVHMLLVCEEEDLPIIMRKLKGKSAQKFKEYLGIPKEETFNLWAQKFDSKLILSEEQFQNTLKYIVNNRDKHFKKAEEKRNTTPDSDEYQNKGLQPLAIGNMDSLPDPDDPMTINKGQMPLDIGNTDSTPDPDDPTTSNKGLQPLAIDTMNSPPAPDERMTFSKGLQPLVQMMTCTREHAFRPEYKGGFDVVIGNPPYVQLQSMGEMSEILKNCGYETFDKGADLYCIFTERGYKLLKKGGVQSFIMPNKWMLVEYGRPLRKFLSKTGLCQVLNFGDVQFFQEATTYVCIFVTQKSGPANHVKVLSLNQKTYHGDFLTEVKTNIYDYPAAEFGEKEWSIQPYYDSLKLAQMNAIGIKLKDLPISINYGIKTGFNNAFYIDVETRQKLIDADARSAELIKPMVRGRDIIAYGISGFEYLIGTFPALKLDIEHYPYIKDHLLSFGYDRLKQTGDNGARKKTSGKWFETQDSIGYHLDFAKPKIIYPNMTSVFPFLYDESGLFSNDKSFILTITDDSVSLLFLTALLNSSLAKLWIWYNCPELQGGTREIRKVYFEHFPVPPANEEQTATLANYAEVRALLTENLKVLTSKFQRSIQRKFNLEELPGKLQNWYLLSYREFIAELAKKKVKLSLHGEAEWEAYFLGETKQALAIKSEIEKTDAKIDRMVYQLYELTYEEIKIVEGEL